MKKIISVIILVLLILLSYIGVNYIKDKYFNNDYIECYETILNIEKAYDGDINKAIKKYASNAKVVSKNNRYIKYRNIDKHNSVVTFYINGNHIIGRCASHNDKYIKTVGHKKYLYDALYVSSSFKDENKLNNYSLQQAFFYYENGKNKGNYPIITISNKDYRLIPIYKNNEIILTACKVVSPYNNEGELIEVTSYDYVYKNGKFIKEK